MEISFILHPFYSKLLFFVQGHGRYASSPHPIEHLQKGSGLCIVGFDAQELFQ